MIVVMDIRVVLSQRERDEMRERRLSATRGATRNIDRHIAAKVFSAAIGISPRALFSWERGERHPSLVQYRLWDRTIPPHSRLPQGVYSSVLDSLEAAV